MYKENFKELWVDNWEGEVTGVIKDFLGSTFNIHVKNLDYFTTQVQIKDEETTLTYSRGDLAIASGMIRVLADICGVEVRFQNGDKTPA